LFELSEGDVQLPKLFRQTVPQRWPGDGKTAVTELVAWSLDQACSIVDRPQRMAAHGGNQRTTITTTTTTLNILSRSLLSSTQTRKLCYFCHVTRYEKRRQYYTEQCSL